MTIDAPTVFVLLLASALAGALLGVAPAWRRLMGGDATLPVRRLLLRRGESPTLGQEMRCALCPVRRECARRVAAGGAPLENCPNAALFSSPA